MEDKNPHPISQTNSEMEAAHVDSTTGMELILVTGGCFEMGDIFGDGRPDEKPVHEVCLNDFYIGKCQVTQGQWKKVMGENPSNFSSRGDDCPVEQVSWNDVQEFIRTLNAQSGKKYRLPTEAEWEYAARSGGKAEKWAGTSNETSLEDYAWCSDNAGNKTHPVGQKKPNSLGIYDMTGNIWEWCSDWYGDTYYGASLRENPGGPSSGSERVLRGGSWYFNSWYARTFYRSAIEPDYRYNYLGFRLVANRDQ